MHQRSSAGRISKLPVRQVTNIALIAEQRIISKLPVRQVTLSECDRRRDILSKLPVRQVTSSPAHVAR